MKKKSLSPNKVASCWGHTSWMEPQIVYEWGWFGSEWGGKVATSWRDSNCITSVDTRDSTMTGCEFLEILKSKSEKKKRFLSVFYFLSRCGCVCVRGAKPAAVLEQPELPRQSAEPQHCSAEIKAREWGKALQGINRRVRREGAEGGVNFPSFEKKMSFKRWEKHGGSRKGRKLQASTFAVQCDTIGHPLAW